MQVSKDLEEKRTHGLELSVQLAEVKVQRDQAEAKARSQMEVLEVQIKALESGNEGLNGEGGDGWGRTCRGTSISCRNIHHILLFACTV